MNRKLQKSVSSFDVHHRLAAGFQLPDSVSACFRISAGRMAGERCYHRAICPAVAGYTSRFDPYRNESFNRLMVVGDPNSPRTGRHYAYNSSAFTLPPSTVSEIAATTWCAAIVSERRMFRSSGTSCSSQNRSNFQFCFEATNAFNQVNYQGPVSDHSKRPGAFVATAVPRTIQIGARVRSF